MKTAHPVDTARVELFLSDLRLPAIKQVWAQLAEQSDKEGWPAARFLAALAEHEIADRGRRRIERHLKICEGVVGVGPRMPFWPHASPWGFRQRRVGGREVGKQPGAPQRLDTR
jgi:hypothetical protein